MLHDGRLVPAASLIIGVAAADLVIEVIESDQQAMDVVNLKGVEPTDRVAVGIIYRGVMEQLVEVLLLVFAVAQLQTAVPAFAELTIQIQVAAADGKFVVRLG